MKNKTLGLAAVIVAGALLTGCTADAPARQVHGGIAKSTDSARQAGDLLKAAKDAGKTLSKIVAD